VFRVDPVTPDKGFSLPAKRRLNSLGGKQNRWAGIKTARLEIKPHGGTLNRMAGDLSFIPARGAILFGDARDEKWSRSA